jgi:dTDP-glucose 4,6-dehydratase
VLITRSSNNYGGWQYPEKIIPLFITNAIDDLPLPVYGDGLNVRDWLYVDDNCAAIDTVLREGELGEVYNIGGGNEVPNLALTRRILELLGKGEELIRYVVDRPGHDRRYSIDCAKVRGLGWEPAVAFEDGLERTVAWYRDNPQWWRRLKSGEWREYYAQQYSGLE